MTRTAPCWNGSGLKKEGFLTTRFVTLSRRQKRAQVRPRPLRDTRLTLYVSESEADELDRAAEQQGTPLSSFLRFLVEKGLTSLGEK